MNSSHFHDTRLIDFPAANPLCTKLLVRYGRAGEESSAVASLVKVAIRSPLDRELLWHRVGSMPRGLRRRQLLRAVSVTLQDTLRCWVPYLWLSQPSHWEERDLLWPILIYGASRTFKPLSRECYSFDLMNPTTVPSILRSCLPTLREWLPLLLAVNHHRPVPRREFRIGRLLDVVEQMDFEPHHLKRLLSHEHKVIGAFHDIVDAKLGFRDLEEFSKKLGRHLNRLYTSVDFRFLEPLLHLEAENTIANFLLDQPGLEATIVMAAPPPGTEPFPLPRPAFGYQPQRIPALRQPISRWPVYTI